MSRRFCLRAILLGLAAALLAPFWSKLPLMDIRLGGQLGRKVRMFELMRGDTFCIAAPDWWERGLWRAYSNPCIVWADDGFEWQILATKA